MKEKENSHLEAKENPENLFGICTGLQAASELTIILHPLLAVSSRGPLRPAS